MAAHQAISSKKYALIFCYFRMIWSVLSGMAARRMPSLLLHNCTKDSQNFDPANKNLGLKACRLLLYLMTIARSNATVFATEPPFEPWRNDNIIWQEFRLSWKVAFRMLDSSVLLVQGARWLFLIFIVLLFGQRFAQASKFVHLRSIWALAEANSTTTF